MGQGFTIRVRTELLQSQAEKALTYINRFRTEYGELVRTVEETSGCWRGDAADYRRESFTAQKEQMEEILGRLSEYVTDLADIRENYLAAESANTAAAGDLSENVIF
jgi:WXG100 family type VII secretion target